MKDIKTCVSKTTSAQVKNLLEMFEGYFKEEEVDEDEVEDEDEDSNTEAAEDEQLAEDLNTSL
jgi:hypothetical protein